MGYDHTALAPSQLSLLRLNGEVAWFRLDAQGYLWKITGTLLRLK